MDSGASSLKDLSSDQVRVFLREYDLYVTNVMRKNSRLSSERAVLLDWRKLTEILSDSHLRVVALELSTHMDRMLVSELTHEIIRVYLDTLVEQDYIDSDYDWKKVMEELKYDVHIKGVGGRI